LEAPQPEVRDFYICLDLSMVDNVSITEEVIVERGVTPSSVVMGALIQYGEAVVAVSEEVPSNDNSWPGDLMTEVIYFSRKGH